MKKILFLALFFYTFSILGQLLDTSSRKKDYTQEIDAMENRLNEQLKEFGNKTYKQLTHTSESTDPLIAIDGQAEILFTKHKLNILYALEAEVKQNLGQQQMQEHAKNIQDETLEKIEDVIGNSNDINNPDTILNSIVKQLEAKHSQEYLEFIITMLIKLGLLNNISHPTFSVQNLSKADLIKKAIFLEKMFQETKEVTQRFTASPLFINQLLNQYKDALQKAQPTLESLKQAVIARLVYLDMSQFNTHPKNMNQIMSLITTYQKSLTNNTKTLGKKAANFKQELENILAKQSTELDPKKVRTLQTQLQNLYNNFYTITLDLEIFKNLCSFAIALGNTLYARQQKDQSETLFEQMLPYYTGLFKNSKPDQAYSLLFNEPIIKQLHLEKLLDKDNNLITKKITYEEIKEAYAAVKKEYPQDENTLLLARNAAYLLSNTYERALYDAFLQDYKQLVNHNWLDGETITAEGKAYLLKNGLVQKFEINKKQAENVSQSIHNIEQWLPETENMISKRLHDIELTLAACQVKLYHDT